MASIASMSVRASRVVAFIEGLHKLQAATARAMLNEPIRRGDLQRLA